MRIHCHSRGGGRSLLYLTGLLFSKQANPLVLLHFGRGYVLLCVCESVCVCVQIGTGNVTSSAANQ